jgi:Sensors of blue-light using FAD
MLLLVDRSFFQILEGAPEFVGAVFDKIGCDKRHERVSTGRSHAHA